MCLLSNRISDYPFISQGKTRIPGVNDSSEGVVTDVRTFLQSPAYRERAHCCKITNEYENTLALSRHSSLPELHDLRCGSNVLHFIDFICNVYKLHEKLLYTSLLRIYYIENITIYLISSCLRYTDSCLLSNDIHDYFYVSQGKTTIPNVDDGEEFQLTDVSSQYFVMPLVVQI